MTGTPEPYKVRCEGRGALILTDYGGAIRGAASVQRKGARCGAEHIEFPAADNNAHVVFRYSLLEDHNDRLAHVDSRIEITQFKEGFELTFTGGAEAAIFVEAFRTLLNAITVAPEQTGPEDDQ